MVIESIKLENFRNYETLELTLDPGTNIFYGENAQGTPCSRARRCPL